MRWAAPLSDAGSPRRGAHARRRERRRFHRSSWMGGMAVMRLAGLMLLVMIATHALAAGDGHGGGGGHGAESPKPIEPLPVVPRGLPVELMRTLQLLQDRIAKGSTQAHLAQRQLLVHIEQRLLALEPETWADSANTRAGVSLALAGGGPAVLRRMLDSGKVAEADAPLVLGALAYVEGREKEARTLLAKFDPREAPPSLAGQLALTQAALSVRDAPRKAIELLALARLLAPGTLVEEGALRREIFVIAQGGDASRFEALSIQYLRRFRRSVYAGNFRQRFAAALTRLDFASDGARDAKLARMLDEIEPDDRRDLYLLVARAGLDQGRRGTALFAAERAAGLAAPETAAAAQARLYRAAALVVVEGRLDESIQALRSLDRDQFGEADRRLLDEALSAATQIRIPAQADAARAAAPLSGQRKLPDPAAIGRAQEALARIDRLMDDRNDP